MKASLQKASLAIVVIGRNEGARLSRCLDSVIRLRPDFGTLDIIYVDSNSSDDSISRAAAVGARVISLPPGPTTAARGRNAGWRATDAEFVLFLDGDVILHPDFIGKAVGHFSDSQTAVVWGHRRELAPQNSIYNRILDLDWIYPPGRSEFCGGDALMRRAVLQAVGGYDEQLIAGEEPEMCRRMRMRGFRILHIDEPMTAHDLAITCFRQYWRRAMRAGFAYASVAERFAATEEALWQHEAQRNLMQGSLLMALPFCALGLSLYLRSSMPIAVVAGFFVFLVLRAARRASWKSPGQFLTLLMYGAHSHFQQIPILFGQLKYFRERKREHRLIEYKEAR